MLTLGITIVSMEALAIKMALNKAIKFVNSLDKDEKIVEVETTLDEG